jgi:hypothetical protein
MSNTASNQQGPQTVDFELELSFNRCGTEYREPKEFFHLDFDQMETIARKALRSRMIVDRPTSIRWRTTLTQYGREKMRTDALTARSHSDLNQDWKAWK